jgi:hypothetical protein
MNTNTNTNTNVNVNVNNTDKASIKPRIKTSTKPAVRQAMPCSVMVF